MSKTFYVQGWVDIRVRIDTNVNTTQSAKGDDIAEMVKERICIAIGECEVLNHSLMIDGI